MFSGWYEAVATVPAVKKSLAPYAPLSCTRYRSSAVMRPSLRKPILAQPWKPARARPM